jgi:hypothetical protein
MADPALVLAITSASCRVARLKSRGAELPELDRRLAAAASLAARGDSEGAHALLDEVAVLAKTLALEFGLAGPERGPEELERELADADFRDVVRGEVESVLRDALDQG